MDFSIFTEKQPDTSKDKESPEDVNDPVNSLNYGQSCSDEDTSHNHGTENAPEKDLVLGVSRDAEIGEYHQEDKEVVHTERFFYQIASEELQSAVSAESKEDAQIEE